MNEAIKLAIEKGGYKNNVESAKTDPSWYAYMAIHANGGTMVVCDPLFWQALGKALGWKDVFKNKKSMGLMEMCGHPYCPTEGNCKYQKPERSKYAHKYFDLLLTGGDTEKFWKELLTQNNHDKA